MTNTPLSSCCKAPVNYLQKAINAQVATGGKFFCWHDWIYLGIYFPQSAWEYAKGIDASYLCVKCGKQKADIRAATLTRYDENNHIIQW